MLMPSIFGENLFDDFFDDYFPFDTDKELHKAEKKLYGRRAGHVMKTDIKEKDTQVTVTARPLKDRTYTANWKENSYTIVFNVEGEVTRGEMKNIPLRYTQETTIPKNGYVCGGYKFVGWRTGGKKSEQKVYQPGDKVSR